MKHKENKNTTKNRLTSFFILLAGTSLLICLFALVFSTVYNQRYQRVIEQMTVFHDYYENLDAAVNNLDIYIRIEDEEYYEKTESSIEVVQSSLKNLFKAADNPEILREIQDITDMTAYLKQQLLTLHKDMKTYHDSGADAFFAVHDEYEEVRNVYEAISGQYREINRMILNDIDRTYAQMQQKTKIFMLFFALLFLATCGVMLMQIQNISKSISAPVFALTKKAEQIRQGRLDEAGLLTVPPASDEEIRVLIEVFNEMTKQVKKQIETLEENARVRHELEESRFKELQMQINPHFLFNTLNMIAENAYLENADNTVLLLEKAAKMFRFSLDFSGKDIPLYKEIEELGNYVYMQEQRFGERIQFQFELDESFHHIRVPSLTLQPLVENAIVHGIGMRTGNARILIRTAYEEKEKTGYLVVEDNGEGMSAEKLSQVRRSMEEYSGENMKIGLGNVFLRLKIFSGGKARMRLESAPHKGTRVTIGLPYERGETDVPADYCG